MFEPAADIIKKWDAAKAEVGEGGSSTDETEPTGISKKDKFMTKLLLQQTQLVLAAGIQNYQKVGKEARAAVEPIEFEGVRAAVAQGPQPAESKEALRLVVESGKSSNNKEAKLKATRCFDYQTKTDVDGKTVEETKWVFADMSHPPLMQAMCCMRENGGLQSVIAALEDDSAPRSKAAKELERT
ncbi:unnamed protein product, partial [Prorocentrum cordatum]